MVCIYCGGDTRVYNSRPQKRTNSTWRRRVCEDCHTAFTTIETVDFESSIVLRKKSNQLEPFSRDILLISLYDSLKHRKSAPEDATALVSTIIGKLVSITNKPDIDIAVLTSTTHEILNRFDKVSAVHYKAYYID